MGQYIARLAGEEIAEPVDGAQGEVVIVFQPADISGIQFVCIFKRVGADPPLGHELPERVKSNQERGLLSLVIFLS